MTLDRKLKKSKQHLWTFLLSKLITSLGSSIYSLGISFYILSATGSAMSFAWNLLLSVLPRTLLAPLAGYAIDRYNKKNILLTAQFSSGAAMLVLFFIVQQHSLSLTAIYAATALLSVTSTFSGLAFTASISQLVHGDAIQRAASFNQTSLSLAAIMGPALGGLLYGLLSLPAFIILFAVSFLAAGLLDLTMDFQLFSEKQTEHKPTENMIASIQSGWKYLRGHIVLFKIVSVALFTNFLFSAFTVGFSFMLIEKLHISSVHFGLIEGTNAAGILVASVYMGAAAAQAQPIRTARNGVIIMGLIMGMMTLPLFIQLPYWGNVIFYMGTLLLFGLIGSIVNIPIMVLMQKLTAEAYRGRVFSWMETMSMGLAPLAMILFGYLYDLLPVQAIFIGASSILILFVLVMLPSSFLKETAARDEQY